MNKRILLLAVFLCVGVSLFALTPSQKKELDDLINRTYKENRSRLLKSRSVLVNEINELEKDIRNFKASPKTGSGLDDNLNSQIDASNLYILKGLLKKYKALLKEYDASHPNEKNGQRDATHRNGPGSGSSFDSSSSVETDERYETTKERAKELNSSGLIDSAFDMMSQNRARKSLVDVKTSKEATQVTTSQGINKLKKKVEDNKEKKQSKTKARSNDEVLRLIVAGRGNELTEEEKNNFKKYQKENEY